MIRKESLLPDEQKLFNQIQRGPCRCRSHPSGRGSGSGTVVGRGIGGMRGRSIGIRPYINPYCRVREPGQNLFSNPYRGPYGDYSKKVFPSEQMYGPYTPDGFNNTDDPISRPLNIDSHVDPKQYLPKRDVHIESKPSTLREEF